MLEMLQSSMKNMEMVITQITGIQEITQAAKGNCSKFFETL